MLPRNRTKEMFADHLYKVMVVKPFEKVQVKDICDSCGAPRQTFYYHFHDKYDLVAWIFMQDYESAFSGIGPEDYETALAEIFDTMLLKTGFYRQVFTDKSQNSISRYIQDLDVEMGVEVVRSRFGQDEVSAEQLYLIKYHSYGSIQMTVEWLLSPDRIPSKEFAKMQLASMPEFLREAYTGVSTSK